MEMYSLEEKTVEILFCSRLPAAKGKVWTWTPDSGQGTSYNLTGTGSVAGSHICYNKLSSSSSQ